MWEFVKRKDIHEYHAPDSYWHVPKDIEPECVHFVVVQVSERRSVVAKYAGHALIPAAIGSTIKRPLSFDVITETMTNLEADELAYRLNQERLENIARKKT